MPNNYFRFKQFTIWHDKCAMKVGTDGVLLGAWADIENKKQILDIGTGTGLIALMLAQRSSATIDAIDIETSAIEQAKENFKRSNWNNRIESYHKALQDFTPKHTYDLIVSNPPFFQKSLISPLKERSIARHDETLPISKLFDFASEYLEDKGVFSLIYPIDNFEQALEYGQSKNLYLKRKTLVFPTPESKSKRILSEFSKEKLLNPVVNKIIIESSGRHQYSEEYIHLTKDFYLKM